MSRIGKNAILLSDNITVKLKDQHIIIKGNKGQLEYNIPEQITVEQKKQELIIKTLDNGKKTKQLHGLSRTIINNMVIGVSNGFSKILEVQGVGYRAQLDNKNNLILYVGYSHPINIITPKNINIKIENNNQIIIHGIDKAAVGQLASQIRTIRPPEPYKGKGIRYYNEIIKKKVGKAGK